VITRIVVCGAAGRMGRLLVAQTHRRPDTALAGAVETPDSAALGTDAGELAGVGPLGVPVTDDLRRVVAPETVVVDFTVPQASLDHLRTSVAAGAAIVIGTTGFPAAVEGEMRALAPRTRTVMAPNMSVGVNVLLGAVRHVARALGSGFDVEVVELHHRFKRDAPSGTALALAGAAAGALGRPFPECAVFGRHGQVGERPPDSIGVLALRAGDAAGDHTVVFGGVGERVELTHRAQSRECFAEGALRAAVWVAGRPPGLYSMTDVLGLGG
jgi:4-hydroxy-tetrahydrodipicolinate reductase